MRKIFAVLILIITLSFLPFAVLAQNSQNEGNVILAQNQVVDKDYFAAGNSVSLEGTVNGDAYLAGGNIIVNGTINGDLLATGGNIEIRGTVTGDIRTAGGNININGPVGRNVSAAGGNISFSPDADVSGNLALAGGQVTLRGKTGGDVNAAVGNLSLSPQAAVNGDLTYLSSNRASIPPEATVSGQITQYTPQEPPGPEEAAKGLAAIFTFYKIASFILAAIIGLLLLRFLPVFFEKTTEIVLKKPWQSLGIGFLTIIVFPFLFILLLITVIGIPVAFVLAFILAILLYLAKIFVAFAIGQLVLRLFNRNAGKTWVFLLGLLIYYLVGLIPVIDWLISIIAGLIGLGAILISKKNYYEELRSKQII